MTIEELDVVFEKYCLIALEEDYENVETLDILITCTDALANYYLIGTYCDVLSFGEFTRRFESSLRNLKILLRE